MRPARVGGRQGRSFAQTFAVKATALVATETPAVLHFQPGGSTLSEHPSFEEFIRRIRSGDQQAAVELVRRYESAIRLEVRLHMSDPNLRRCFDSVDICQSFLGSFFVRVAAGQY